MKYKIWDKTSNLVTPIGENLSPAEVIARYPMADLDGFKFVVCDAPISMGVFMEFEQTKMHYAQIYKLDFTGKTDQEVLDMITYAEENPPAPAPSAEERTAAALEFANILAMPDTTV